MTLLMLSLFIISAVFGRMLRQYKMTGDHGIRLASKDSPPVQIVASVMLLLSGLVILYCTLGLAIGFFKLNFVPTLFQILMGVFFYSIGLIIVLISQYQMGSAWRIGVDANEKTALVTDGLFKHVRNPIYTGLFIGSMGLWLVSPSILLMLGLLGLYVAVELFVRKVEEPYLLEQFGVEYNEWYHSTPRYFPNFNQK